MKTTRAEQKRDAETSRNSDAQPEAVSIPIPMIEIG